MSSYGIEEEFELSVEHEGKQLMLPAKLKTLGYTYKIYVAISGTEIIFEPDEERNLRAIVQPQDTDRISASLVNAVGVALEKALR